ncbi:hypothetical protein GCM10023188_07650 [Pontibacter saemangeumensis]|uniref:Uncharacterized protein n=1 Tax=Pontibacter saemangeumensis TaxID=1084525 RepID=A0ABP8LCU1_9BACT
MSNKLLLGLLLTILVFITVMLGTAKFYEQERKDQERANQELVPPPAPPAVPEPTAPPVAE